MPATTNPNAGWHGAAARWLTLGIVLASVAGVAAGSGALGGTPINEAADGWLSSDATPIAPATQAFSIWSVLYSGLILWSIAQVIPRFGSTERMARIRPWAIASAVLNTAWIWAVQLGLLWLSVVVIAALAAVLVRLALLLRAHPSANLADTVLSDGTFGLYLGWVQVAAFANLAALLASMGADLAIGNGWVAVSLLGAIVLVAALTARAIGGRLTPAAAMAWGLVWVAVGRTSGQFEAPVIGVGAIVAAVLVVAMAVGYRLRDRQKER